MPEVVAGGPVGDKMGTVVCDLDGVIYIDGFGVPGAGAALDRLTDAGIELLFVTNNPNKTAQMVVDDIGSATGFEASRSQVITSGMATAHHLGGRIETALVVGGAGLIHALEHAGIEIVTDWTRAGAVVVGLDRGLDYERLKAATLALRAGSRFVASSLDPTFPGREGLYPGTGSIVAALQAASGRSPVVCGKPHEPMRQLVRARVDAGRVMVIGDRPETDLAIADAEGWESALVLSGVTYGAEAINTSVTPDVVLDSIAGLPDHLGL